MRCICTNSAWSEADRGPKLVCEFGVRTTLNFWTTPSFFSDHAELWARDDGRWDETHGDNRCGVMTLYPIRCTRYEAQDGCKWDCTSEGLAAMPNTARYVVYVELIQVVQCSDRPHPEYERLRHLRFTGQKPPGRCSFSSRWVLKAGSNRHRKTSFNSFSKREYAAC